MIVPIYTCTQCGEQDGLILASTVRQTPDGSFDVEVETGEGHYCGNCEDDVEVRCSIVDTLYKNYGEMIWRVVLGEYLIERMDESMGWDSNQNDFNHDSVVHGRVGYAEMSYNQMLVECRTWLDSCNGLCTNLFWELELKLCLHFDMIELAKEISLEWDVPLLTDELDEDYNKMEIS